MRYHAQEPIGYKPAPRGSTPCPGNCSGVGNCNYDTGLCDCPAGYGGPSCGDAQLRPCTSFFRGGGMGQTVASHVDANGRDLDWASEGGLASRCPGVCDITIGACFCDDPNYGFIPAPAGSRLGSPPTRRGRMLGTHCRPDKDPLGDPITWGTMEADKIYGPEGWCSSAKPKNECGCNLDGHDAPNCSHTYEMVCPNQCSARGECNLGFCKCHEGWYGTDCARKVAGAELEPQESLLAAKPWLKPTMRHAPEAVAEQLPPQATRMRPLIYVYDMPPEFTTRFWQYRIIKRACVYRLFDAHTNTTIPETQNLYALEHYLHEMLLQSDHRTFDPEEADFFYVPVYSACYFWPIHGHADYPLYPGPGHQRPMQAANLLLDAKRHIERTYPFWNRTGGQDHVWLAPSDEGACWWPSEIYNTSTMLTHWGRMDIDHQSNTAYGMDNYTDPQFLSEWYPQDWRNIYKGHACYTPGKDLVVPSLKWPHHYESSGPFRGLEHRDVLLFFKGDMGQHREKHYSRGIRQRVSAAAEAGGWKDKYRIWVGHGENSLEGTYSEGLSRSTFCLVLPGDGWSSRAEDAVLHGCIPVVIMDRVHAVFESILDWDLFSVRVAESEVESLPQILAAISDARVRRMQARIGRIWTRFAYTTGSLFRGALLKSLEKISRESKIGPEVRARPLGEHPVFRADDALSTIMQWLFSKAQARDGGAQGAGAG
ncbi:hypothetical protein FOA52_005547 [Chlamydomonas sp. UWO 241]|nr:hypothetical protein FOA52_005547 [Chlamydomonas sp. UWO 241]